MKNIRKLFDYQRFEENERLSSMIRRTESKYLGSSRQELDEDDLFFVNAAGSREAYQKDDPKDVAELDQYQRIMEKIRKNATNMPGDGER
jgi:hypothetical protein